MVSVNQNGEYNSFNWYWETLVSNTQQGWNQLKNTSLHILQCHLPELTKNKDLSKM